MNKFSQFALASAACCITTLTQANTTYSARFALQGELPRLRSGIPGFDGPDSLPGKWSNWNNIDARATSRDLLSSTVHPVTGVQEQTWGQLNHSANKDRGGSPPFRMGQSYAFIVGPNAWTRTTASASVSYTSLGANVTLTDRFADASALATWSSDFSLDAHSSFTFSGLATVGITGDSTPLAAVTTFDIKDSFASLTLGDLFGRVRTTIGANIWGISTGLSDIVSYSVGPNGLLALTITNDGDSALRGSLNAGSYVVVSPPVPEPETWLLLLAGAGMVGLTASKRPRVTTPPAAA